MNWFLLLLLLATPAFAERYPLREGTLEFDSILSGTGPVYLRGRHFVFDGWVRSARLDAADCSYPCAGGETVSLVMFGNDVIGIATFKDVQYTDFNNPVGITTMQIEIAGRTKLPQIRNRDSATKMALVRIKVTFIHPEIPFNEPVTEVFVGDAIATLALELFPEEYGGKKYWYIDHLAYDVVR